MLFVPNIIVNQIFASMENVQQSLKDLHISEI